MEAPYGTKLARMLVPEMVYLPSASGPGTDVVLDVA